MRQRLFAALMLVLTLPSAAQAAPEPLATLLAQEQELMAHAAKQPDDPQATPRMAALRAEIAAQKFLTNDLDGAIAYLENAVALDPSRPARWAMLGDLYQLIGVPGARFLAQDAYERALQLDPERRETRIKLAALYLTTQQFLKAVDAFEAVIPAPSGIPDGEYIVPLAVAYTVSDQAGRGIKFCDKMLKAGGDGRFRTAQAVLKHHQGDARAAIKLLKQVETDTAGTPLARYAIQLRHGYEDELEAKR